MIRKSNRTIVNQQSPTELPAVIEQTHMVVAGHTWLINPNKEWNVQFCLILTNKSFRVNSHIQLVVLYYTADLTKNRKDSSPEKSEPRESGIRVDFCF